MFLGAVSASALQQQTDVAAPEKDWACPMDPDYRAAGPGKCPRCGMPLALHVPDRVEFPVEITQSPDLLRPNDLAHINLRIIDPATGKPATRFDIVHEKLLHLFVVGQNLTFFAHVHPVAQKDGSFLEDIRLPHGGFYRLLADFYPSGSVPQLALGTVFVSGDAPAGNLVPNVAPIQAKNMSASLQLDPVVPLAGLETKLIYNFEPDTGLQPYLGAWGHMLAASSDLIDMLHVHPFLGQGRSPLQFNIIFPRAGLYRVWAQFQREGVVNTTAFTIPVKSL